PLCQRQLDVLTIDPATAHYAAKVMADGHLLVSGKKSMIENIGRRLRSAWPGQRMKQKVRMEPSVASPSSPRNVPGTAHVGRSLVVIFTKGLSGRAVVGREHE